MTNINPSFNVTPHTIRFHLAFNGIDRIRSERNRRSLSLSPHYIHILKPQKSSSSPPRALPRNGKRGRADNMSLHSIAVCILFDLPAQEFGSIHA